MGSKFEATWKGLEEGEGGGGGGGGGEGKEGTEEKEAEGGGGAVDNEVPPPPPMSPVSQASSPSVVRYDSFADEQLIRWVRSRLSTA